MRGGARGADASVGTSDKTGDAAPASSFINVSTVLPNPATDQVTVRYALADDAEVSVRVYDVRGREVASVATVSHSAGTYASQIGTSALVPGVYVVRVVAAGNGASRQSEASFTIAR